MKHFLIATLILCFGIQPAFSQEVSKEYEKSVRELIKVSGQNKTFEATISQMIGIFREQYTDVPSEMWDDMEREFKKTSINDLVSLLAPIYSRHLSISDLQGVIDFYNSDVGKKYAEKTPAIMQESMQAGQEWGRAIGEKIAKKIQEGKYD